MGLVRCCQCSFARTARQETRVRSERRRPVSYIQGNRWQPRQPRRRSKAPANSNPITIGVLALQGDYEAHARAFKSSGARTVLVRKAGGTGRSRRAGDARRRIDHHAQVSREATDSSTRSASLSPATPVFATCAGCILLAREVLHPKQRSLGALDATVERNAYGRQIDSTILTLPTELPGGPLEMVFIRSPRITRVGEGVESSPSRDGFPILVRQGHLLAATFHPEMTADTRVQQLFLDMVRKHKTG